MSDEHRSKIANSQILNRLISHAVGDIELSATQAATGIALLKKVMPDLQSVEISGTGEDGAIGITFKTIYQSE